MMYSGSLFWNEVMPRIRTVLREPGEPLASTVTPDTLPSSRCSTLVVVCFWRLSTSTVPRGDFAGDLDLRRGLLAQCSSAHGQGEQHTHPHRAEEVEMPGPGPTLTLEHVVHGGALIPAGRRMAVRPCLVIRSRYVISTTFRAFTVPVHLCEVSASTEVGEEKRRRTKNATAHR